MSVEGGRVAQQQGLLPADAEKLKGLYLAVIIILGLAFLFGVVAWVVLVMMNKVMPEGLGVIIGTVGGGLVGVLTAPSTAGKAGT